MLTLNVVGHGDPRGSGRRFHARLKGASGARYVRIVAGAKGSRRTRTTTIRVRG